MGKLANISDIVAYATILWVGGILLISFGWNDGQAFLATGAASGLHAAAARA